MTQNAPSPRLAVPSLQPVDPHSVLTESDRQTLHDVARAGVGANSLKALSSDLRYLEAWCMAATHAPLPWPAPEALVLKFLAHHAFDPLKRDAEPDHGMPAGVEEALRKQGVLRGTLPHAVSTTKRRMSSWASAHQWKGTEGSFSAASVRTAARLAGRANTRRPQRKSPKSLDVEAVRAMVCALDDEISSHALNTTATSAVALRAVRDRALISVGFASGGRRRSELAALRWDDIEWAKQSQGAPFVSMWLGRTKTLNASDGVSVPVRGRAAEHLRAWHSLAVASSRAMFPGIDRWGYFSAAGMSGAAINAVIKSRAAQAGLNPEEVSAHGLRSGFMTSACLAGASLPEAMALSTHRSTKAAARYFDEASAAAGVAARLLD